MMGHYDTCMDGRCPNCGGGEHKDGICPFQWKTTRLVKEGKSMNTEFVNDRYVKQIGGEHYQSKYQHWDWVTDLQLDYLSGCATKYVSRWRNKNGLEDLKKAMSYVDKLIATDKKVKKSLLFPEVVEKTAKFVHENGLLYFEGEFCFVLATDENPSRFEKAKTILARIIADAQVAANAMVAGQQ